MNGSVPYSLQGSFLQKHCKNQGIKIKKSRMKNRMTNKVKNWMINRMKNWMTNRMTRRVKNRVKNWMTNRMTRRVKNRVTIKQVAIRKTMVEISPLKTYPRGLLEIWL
jgi:hypothetical protein